MADLPTIERTISGKGEIKIPIQYADAKNVFLYTQVIRDVFTPSVNLRWNPRRGFYAHITFCIDDWVLYELDCNFKTQVFQVFDGMSAQLLLSMKCAAAEILGRTPLIQEHTHNTFVPNRIRFYCYESVALVLTLKGEKLDLCNPDDSKPNAPPPPPPKIPEIPPNTNTEVDRPYPDDPEGNNTAPNPGDELKPPEGAGECLLYQVDTTITRPDETSFLSTYYARGPVEDARILFNPDGSEAIQIRSRGASSSQTGLTCTDLDWYTVGGSSGSGNYLSISIDLITLIPE